MASTDELLEATVRIIRLRDALRAIRDFDAFQGGPIAPRESPTTQRMRRIAAEALESPDLRTDA